MHVIGIDAGGTKSVCYVADASGALVGEARGGGANLQSEGELSVEKTLHTLMEDALGGRSLDVAAICLGMAGVDRHDDARVARGILRRIGARARILVVNDALVALVAGVGSDTPGVVIVCGTGSIAYGRDARGVAARAGGWGHVLGDEGSGYWIGRRALGAVTRAADGRGPATALTAKVLAHFGVAQASDLIYEIYDRQVRPQTVARVAHAVQEARAEGDDVAATILDEAAQELVTAARSVATRLRLLDTPFDWLLSGGVFQGVPWLADELGRRLPLVAPRSRVRALDVEPALGALRLALDEAKGGARIPSYAG